MANIIDKNNKLYNTLGKKNKKNTLGTVKNKIK